MSRISTGLVLAVLLIPCTQVQAQQTTTPAPTSFANPTTVTSRRAIRRDVPMTRAIQRAFEAGVRDFSGKPGNHYWQLETDFTIYASIDPSTQVLSGSETITLHNNSPDALNQIALRLDHNIFRADVPRGSSVPAEQTQGMVLTRLVVNGTPINLHQRRPSFRRGQPSAPRNAVSGLNDTVAMISLAEPIPPGAKAMIEIDWNTKLPGGPNGQGHRMTQRWDNTLFQPTQWFPRIAKYDDLRGWDTSVYLGPAEFFNNFGRFDVKIDMPGGWIVSGTGVLQNPEEVLTAAARERLKNVLNSDNEITIVGEDEVGPGSATADGESLVWHFVADKVNDFAFATAEKFVWKATRATIPEKGPIPINMVYIPERARYFENAGSISRHALEFYSDLWAPYPFPQLTLQDGPSAGMEYPMVINSNQGAADHEVAHQWWPMMLGTNETWYGWMDEGFNSYMNILSRAHSRNEEPNLNGLGQSYGSMSGNEEEASMMYAANYAGPSYGFQTYRKAPLMLSMLGGIVGDEAVQKAMSDYTHAWAFKHPSPWDYMFFMSNSLKQDLGWFWYYWLFTTESVDGGISDVKSSSRRTTVVVRQDGEMPSPVVIDVHLTGTGRANSTMQNAVVRDDKTVRFTWPADVFFNGSRTFEAVIDIGTSQIEKIVLDPACRFPDKNPSDNMWPPVPGGVTPAPNCDG